MQDNARTGAVTGALTGLFLSSVHVLPFTTSIDALDILWIVISSSLGGIGGSVVGRVAKYMMFGSMIDFRILCGIVGGGITYIIQVYVMALYSIAYPKFVP